MGNSSSKQEGRKGKGATYSPPRAQEVLLYGTSHDNGRRSKEQTSISPQAGIVPHPFQVDNGSEYHDESSSSDEEESYVEPTELFQEKNIIPTLRYSHISNKNNNNNNSYSHNHNHSYSHSQGSNQNQSRPSMQSMGSLAYSESAASITSRSLSLASQPDNAGTGTSKGLPLAEAKKKGFFRKRTKKKDEKKQVPHEETLSFKMNQYYYGDGDGGDADSHSQEGSQAHSQHTGTSLGSRPGARFGHARNSSSTMHDVSDLFGMKLPTIADVSYQSSTAGYDAEEDLPDMSNILGDLVRDDYKEEERKEEREDEGSMVSKEYTVKTEEMVDLPNAYSATKNVESLKCIERMNSMLDKQHASYVEGQEPLADISMPMQDLRGLFANVTMNDTMNDNGYQTLDESGFSRIFQETTLDRTDFAEETHVDAAGSVFGKNGKAVEESNQVPDSMDKDGVGIDDDKDDDDAFELFVIGRTDSFRENEEKSNREGWEANEPNTKSDNEGDILIESDVDKDCDILNDYVFLSESSVDQSIGGPVANADTKSIQEPNGDEESIEEVLSESSAEDSKFDESLFNTSAADSNSILSDSSADQSGIKESLLENNSSRMRDELSEGSFEDEDIIDCTNMNHLDQTDMAIKEDILDCTDGAINPATNDTRAAMLKMLETDGQDSDNSSIGELFGCNNDDVATMTTAHIDKNLKGKERKRSPYPENEVKMPITSALTNMLPAFSQNEDEEEEEMNSDENKNAFEIEKVEDNVDFQKNSKPGVIDVKQQQRSQVPGNEYKGPDIGTVICCVRNEQKSGHNDVPAEDILIKSSQDTVVEKKRMSNAAYSSQVATNSAFLFSQGDVRRKQLLRLSTVDEQRLHILKKQQLKEEEQPESSSFGISFNDSEATIKERFDKLKSENNKAIISRSKRSSVSISKINAGIQVNSRGTQRLSIAQKPTTSIMGLSAQFNKAVKIGSSRALEMSRSERTIQLKNSLEIGSSEKKSTLGRLKRSSDDAMETHAINSSPKRNRLYTHITATQDGDKKDSGSKRRSDVVSRNTFVSDDISLSELQIRQSAITPMKNPKSPYIRFKRNIRLFETNNSRAEPPKANEPRKTPPRKNAAAGKEFLFEKGVTLIDGRLRQNRPILAKTQRRLTSSLDSSAPRSPTLTDPLFKKQKYEIAISESVDDDDADYRRTDLAIFAEGNDDGQCDSPFDEMDELDLSPSSNESERLSYLGSGVEDDLVDIPKPALSETSMLSPSSDVFDHMLDDVSVESPSLSVKSYVAEEDPFGLRSVMKKKGETNTNNRVSWFGKVVEKSGSPKSSRPNLKRNLDRSFALSPNDNNSRASQTPPRPSPSKPFPAVARASSFNVYSPARESLASHSPLYIKQNVTALVNPIAMNMHSSADASQAENSQASFSPILNYRDGAAVTPSLRSGATNQPELSLSPGPGRRTPSQNRKWTGTSKTPTKNWRDLGAELKKKKKSDKKKKKNRLSSGPLRLLNR